STFEEIYESDLVLLLVDASDPENEILRKVRLAARTLLPRVPADRILPVLTKTDLVPADRLEDVARLLEASEFHAWPIPTSTASHSLRLTLPGAAPTRHGIPPSVPDLQLRHLPLDPPPVPLRERVRREALDPLQVLQEALLRRRVDQGLELPRLLHGVREVEPADQHHERGDARLS